MDETVFAKKSVYLASNYGFSASVRAQLLPQMMGILTGMGIRVHEPFEHSGEGAKTAVSQGPGWAYRVGQADVAAVRECDGIFAVMNGNPPDEGVCVELGIAMALNKPVFLFRDDFRTCAACEDYPLNLMCFAGCPEATWREHYYSSVEEITQPDKALAKWVRGEL